MQKRAEQAIDDVKELPREIRNSIRNGTMSLMERVRRRFDGDNQGPRPQHVVPRGDGWAVVPQGSGRATKLYGVKADAFKAARKTAKREGGVLIVHRQDGTVQEVRNYQET